MNQHLRGYAEQKMKHERKIDKSGRQLRGPLSIIDDTLRFKYTANTAENGPEDCSRMGVVPQQTKKPRNQKHTAIRVASESRQRAQEDWPTVLSPVAPGATLMREHQSVIGQSVGHHIILAVDVVHRPMNPALSKGVTEGDAGSKVRPQVGRSASSLPAAKYDNLARDNLGVQFEDDPLINVCHAKRPLHAALETQRIQRCY